MISEHLVASSLAPVATATASSPCSGPSMRAQDLSTKEEAGGLDQLRFIWSHHTLTSWHSWKFARTMVTSCREHETCLQQYGSVICSCTESRKRKNGAYSARKFHSFVLCINTSVTHIHFFAVVNLRHECPGLSSVFGQEYVALYTKYEEKGMARKVIPARTVWNAIVTSQIETGKLLMRAHFLVYGSKN